MKAAKKEYEIDVLSFANLKAVIMYEDKPVLRVVFDSDGKLVMCAINNKYSNLSPIKDSSHPIEVAIIKFLIERVCLVAMLTADEFKKSDVILFPNMIRYLTYTYGQSVFDKYWLDIDIDYNCFKDTLLEFTTFPKRTYKQLPIYKYSDEIKQFVEELEKGN